MGRNSITGGVTPAGPSRIQFDFIIDSVRFRPTLPWPATAANLERARRHLARIKAQIEAGTFCFAEVFPDYKGLTTVPATVRTRSCGEIFDDFLQHEKRRVARGDLAPVTLTSHRQILDHVWRPHLGRLPFLGIPHSMLIKIADAQNWNKKTYNNAISALRRAFAFGFLDYPERRDPAASLRCSRIGRKDRPAIDPFSIQDAEVLIAALHRDWGEGQGNYDELRFFTGLRPSEEIALVVTDYDRQRGVLSVTKARVGGIDNVCELEPDAGPQSTVGRQRAWPPYHYDVDRLCRMDRGRRRIRHRCHPSRPEAKALERSRHSLGRSQGSCPDSHLRP